MVAYNFKGQFAQMVESGEKRQTIRPLGKRRHVKPGEIIQLYTGQRTANCRLLGTAKCKEIVPVKMRILRLASVAAHYIDGETETDEQGHQSLVIKTRPMAQITYLHIWGRPELIIGETPKDWEMANDVMDNFARADGFRPVPGLSAAQVAAAFFAREHGAGEFNGLRIKWEPEK